MPPLARTQEEAHLFLDLHACSCGGQDAARDSAVTMADGVWLTRYTCTCAACGRTREISFRQPDVPARPTDGGWAVGPTPSELLDAGEWLWISEQFGAAPAEFAGLSPDEAAGARADLAAAAGAVDEVLKFLPAGADEVPDSAFWTERGRGVRAAGPDRFQRLRLGAIRDSYRALLAAQR
jgi:hypothetical protein